MTSSVPPEIILLFLQACSDTDTIRACSLVCHHWASLAQSVLFGRSKTLLVDEQSSILNILPGFMRRRRQHTPAQLLEDLESSKSTGLLIRDIRFRTDGGSDETTTSKLMHLLPNLQSLTLQIQRRQTLLAFPSFPNNFSLTKLVLQNVALKRFNQHLLRLPHLLDLTLEHVCFIEWAESTDTMIPRLEALSVCMPQIRFNIFLEHILPHITALRRLDVNCIDNRHAPSDSLATLLDLNHSTLEFISLHQPATLPSLPCLRTLSLASTPRVEPFLRYVHGTLQTLHSTSESSQRLHKLILRLSGSYLLCDLGAHSALWAELQEVALLTTQHTHLVIERSVEDSLDEFSEGRHPVVSISDLTVHPSLEKLRSSRRISLAVEVIDS